MAEGAPEGPVIRFRNYQPKSDELQGLSVEKPDAPNVEDLVGPSVAIHNDATQEPLLNLAPKKINWDLKRDLEPQLKKLRAATDRAIIELIRERVGNEQQSETQDGASQGANLAAAVEQRARVEAQEEND